MGSGTTGAITLWWNASVSTATITTATTTNLYFTAASGTTIGLASTTFSSTNITPQVAFTIGTTTQNLTLQGSSTSITSFASTTLAPARDSNLFVRLSGAGKAVFSVGSSTGVQIVATSSPLNDLLNISNAGQGVTTTNVNGLSINYTGGSAAIEAAAQRIDLNPGTLASGTWDGIRIFATGTAVGVISNGLKFENIQTPGAGIDNAIQIGNGWDFDIQFLSTTSTLRIPNATGTTWSISNGTSTLLNLRLIGTNNFGSSTFGAMVSAGGFEGKNSYFSEEFTSFRGGDCRGTVVAAASLVQSRGSFGNPSTACTANTGELSLSFSTSTNSTPSASWAALSSSTALNGVEELRASSTGGLLSSSWGSSVSEYLGTNTAEVSLKPFAAVNLPVVAMKIQKDTFSSSSRSFVGLASSSPQSVGAVNSLSGTSTPRDGIFFSNCYASTTAPGAPACDTGWYGSVSNNGTLSTTSCSGAALPLANKWAYMKIEVRGPTDVHFFVDKDVSNGIQEVECGTGVTTSTGATALSMLFMHGQHASGATTTSRLAMDYFRVWQDDSATPVVQNDFTQNIVEKLAVDLNNQSSFAQIFNASGTIDEGTLVALDTLKGNNSVTSTLRAYDPNLLGVVVGSPGLTLGDSSADGVRVATYGRALVNVSSENGPIEVGNYLTSSNAPGVAMRADKGGSVIGQALTSYNGSSTGSVVVLIGPRSYGGPSLDTLLSDGLMPDTILSSTLSSDSSYSEAALIDSNFSKQVLANFINVGKNRPYATSTSDIFIDRLGAGIEIITPHVTTEGLTVDHVSSLNDAISFSNDVVFFGRPYFTSDTGGFATISEGARRVQVTFDKEYIDSPVVNASIALENSGSEDQIFSDNVQYLITDKSTKGFTIMLNHSAPIDMKFSWIALAVKNAKVFTSVTTGTNSNTTPTTNNAPPSTSSGNSSPVDNSSSTLPSGASSTNNGPPAVLPDLTNSTDTTILDASSTSP